MRVGIVGTGYAARLRAEALQQEKRCELVAVAGRDRDRTARFAEGFEVTALPDCEALLQAFDVDLVFVSTINCDHARIARQVLEAGKHVVVEYPLAFDLSEARGLVALAKCQNRLLHVEHIELLSGIHLALKRELPALGAILYANYVSVKAVHPAPQRWTYQPDLFGFPLLGALSRIHRLVDLLGAVERVSCQVRYRGPDLPDRFSSCLCSAQLTFCSGAVADVVYAKGESLWRSRRTIELRREGIDSVRGGTQCGD